MKYFPLIWAALRRRPLRTLLGFVSVVVAFTLFGLTIGVNAGLAHMADVARADRLYVSGRYAGALTLAQQGRIMRLDGVTRIAFFGNLAGYRREPRNRIGVMMVDPGMRAVFPELPITPPQWDAMTSMRNGVIFSRAMATRLSARAGDDFPLLTPEPSRGDGSRLWDFQLLAVVDDIPFFPAGFAIGNYRYLDQARPLGERGTVGQFWLLIRNSARAEETVAAIDGMFANSPFPTRSESEKSLMEAIGGPGSDAALAIDAIAGLGLFMILFLTANAIAQSVRGRLTEFAVLKTVGFSSFGVMALLFAEACIPCVTGAATGLLLAKLVTLALPYLLPPDAIFPMPYLSFGVVASGFAAAMVLALGSTAIPALRVARLDVASVFARH